MFGSKKGRAKKILQVNDKKLGSKFKFADSLNLYTRILADKLTGGSSDKPPVALGKNEFYYSSDRIYTRKGVKKILFITDMPPELPRGFVTDIRHYINNTVSKYNSTHGMSEEVDVGLIIDAENYDLDFTDRRTQGRWEYFTRQYERAMKKAGKKKLVDELKSDKYSEEVKNMINSFLYMLEAKNTYDSSFFKTTLILELRSTSSDILDVAEKSLKGYLYKTKIKLKPIFIQTNEYQRSYMPTSNVKKTLLRSMHEGRILADDTLASLSLTTHGRIGDPIGVPHGIDTESKLPVSLDFTKGTDANNILLTASTGEGKSMLAKLIYTFLMADNDYRTIIMDYEGQQYDEIGKLGDANIISMGEHGGMYVNTMVIADSVGIESIDNNRKIEAVSSTRRVFDLIFNDTYGMDTLERAIFSSVLNEVYADFGVTDDPKTFHLSKECTFYHVYAKAVSYKKRTDKQREYGEEGINDFVMTLQPYFEKGGTESHWFKNPIGMDDIVNNDHLIFSFGMKGRDESMVDTKLVAIRQLFASYLINMLSAKNKSENKRTVVMIEEMQRYLNQRYSGEILAGIASGGRKLGMVVYYITNSPNDMFEAGGADENLYKHVNTIMSSITTTIIGALYKKDVNKIIDFFELENSMAELYELSRIKEENKDNDPLKYCFYIRYKGQSTLIRALSHPALEQLPLYDAPKDPNTGKELTEQEYMRMNIGEDGLATKIKLAMEEEKTRQRTNQSWKTRINSGSKTGVWLDSGD